MYVRPWRTEIRFNKTGKMGPGNSGEGNLGSRIEKLFLLRPQLIMSFIVRSFLTKTQSK